MNGGWNFSVAWEDAMRKTNSEWEFFRLPMFFPTGDEESGSGTFPGEFVAWGGPWSTDLFRGPAAMEEMDRQTVL